MAITFKMVYYISQDVILEQSVKTKQNPMVNTATQTHTLGFQKLLR